MSVKWTDLLLKLGARVPLNIGERAVLLAVCFRADDSGECGFCKSDIAAQMGMSKQAVQRIFSRLQAMHLIERHIPHGLSLCTEELESYQPAPVGSGELYAGNPQSARKTVNPRMTEVNPRMTDDEENEDMPGKPSDDRGKPPDDRAVNPRMTESKPSDDHIYKTDIKDTQDSACACARDVSTSQGAAAPTPPQDTEGTKDANKDTKPADTLEAFIAGYPKAPRDRAKLGDAWYDATVARQRSPKALMAALARAKATKAWTEEDGRYVPRPEVWLAERGYEALLTADERLTPDQRKARAIGGLEATLASIAHYGYTPAEIARIRSKATPLVLSGMSPDDAASKAVGELGL